jgi:parallel beta helix pectate lyase-like protein
MTRLALCASFALATAGCDGGSHSAAGGMVAEPTTYFVSFSGSDASDGKTRVHAFQHIQRCADVLVAGDRCLVEPGTYRETIFPKSSGSLQSLITYEGSGTGPVVIDGADEVRSWSAVAPADAVDLGIATATLSTASSEHRLWMAPIGSRDSLASDQVFMDGQMLTKARWPGSGSDQLHPRLARAGAGTAESAIVDPLLNQPEAYWNGTGIHLWGGYAYMSETGTVKSSSPGQLVLEGASARCPYLCAQEGTPYFLTGTPAAMSEPGQWFILAGTLFVWMPDASSPGDHEIEIKERDFGFDLAGRSNINVEGFNLFATSIFTDANSHNNVMRRLWVRYVSDFTTISVPNPKGFKVTDPQLVPAAVIASHLLDSGIIIQGSYNRLEDSVVEYSAGNGVSMQGSHNTATNLLISETNYMGTYGAGIYVQGSNQVVSHNTIRDSGRDGITVIFFYNGYNFPDNTISYNDIGNAGMLNQDSGGIYVCCELNATGSVIDHNWVHDLQAKTTRGTLGFSGGGIYIDEESNHFLIHHNVSWNNAGIGLILNGYGPAKATHANLVFNNTIGAGQVRSLVVGGVADAQGTRIVNNIFRGLVDHPVTDDGAYVASNLPYTVDPKFRNWRDGDWSLSDSSPAIGAGVPIDGITGTVHPDLGAYQSGEPAWVPGCSLPGCKTMTMDDQQASPGGGFSYSGPTWFHCVCDLTDSGVFDFGGTFSSTQAQGSVATVNFKGSGLLLYAVVGPDQGLASIRVDGGPTTVVDLYQPSPAADVQVFNTGLIADGQHEVTVTVVGGRDSLSRGNYVSLDRADAVQ